MSRRPVINVPDRFEAPIPGESQTVAPGQYAYERPPQYVDVEQALDWVFGRLMNPIHTAPILAMIEGGLPLSFLAESIASTGVSEGRWSIPMKYRLGGPITVMLYRMAEAAGIQPRINGDDGQDNLVPEVMLHMAKTKVDSERVDRAVDSVEHTRNDLPKDRGALMTPMITRHREE